MTNLRLWHSYLSVFVAPTILFFALTGALQLFNLHEARPGYQPAALIEKLGRLHKDQIFALDERHERPPAPEESKSSPPHDEPGEGEDETAVSTWVLKWFCLAASLVLVLTTCLGLWIALTHIKRKATSAWLLLAGILLPIILIIV